jgi:hypothetical protein
VRSLCITIYKTVFTAVKSVFYPIRFNPNSYFEPNHVDESTLEPLLSFAARYVAHPRYARLIVAVAHKMLDLYASVLGHSDAIDELFLKLHRQVSFGMMVL